VIREAVGVENVRKVTQAQPYRILVSAAGAGGATSGTLAGLSDRAGHE
jgi:hypothetical protein